MKNESMFKNSRKAGFTLAEVLITLSIIGVVAAMTLPTLVAKYHEKQRVTQLKKAYSVLNQAFLRAVNDYGTPDNWGLTITDTGEKDEEGNAVYDRTGGLNVGKILAKYINCKPLKKGTMQSNTTYSLDGRIVSEMSPWKTEEDNNSYQMNDGTIFSSGWIGNISCNPTCGDFWVVLPGGSKKTIGVDIFNFKLTKKGIVPIDNSNFKQKCDRDGSGVEVSTQGRGCTGWVLYNDNMDYLHCDDLSWEGKTKCK